MLIGKSWVTSLQSAIFCRSPSYGCSAAYFSAAGPSNPPSSKDAAVVSFNPCIPVRWPPRTVTATAIGQAIIELICASGVFEGGGKIKPVFCQLGRKK